ncbi:MAG: CBS domain-containing protein [ANME-2 cluster archaeon]|nr:CBS domain-containing protein [ANME-2 cluster archaeon]
MKVKDIMSTSVYVIEADEPVSYARNLMMKHAISRLVIVKKPQLEVSTSRSAEMIPIGVVTKTDLTHRLDQAEPKWRRRPIDNIPVQIVMTPDPVTIYPDATLKQAAENLIENEISGMPVVKSESDPGMVGILTKLDLIRYYSNSEDPANVKDIMEDYFITVHRHHSISHVIHEMKSNEVERVIVVDDKNDPVGIITHTNLALGRMLNQEGGLPSKDVKMARKNRDGGEKIFRSVKEVSMVAEDIMSCPIFTLSEKSTAVEAARIMVDKRINGIPIVNDEIIGIVNARNIIQAIIER